MGRHSGDAKFFCASSVVLLALFLQHLTFAQAAGTYTLPASLNDCDETVDPLNPAACNQGVLERDTLQNAQDRSTVVANQVTATINDCEGQACSLGLNTDHTLNSEFQLRDQSVENVLNSDGLVNDATNYYIQAVRFEDLKTVAETEVSLNPALSGSPYVIPSGAGSGSELSAAATGADPILTEMQSQFPGAFTGVTYDDFTDVVAEFVTAYSATMADLSLTTAMKYNDLATKNADTADALGGLRADTEQRRVELRSLGDTGDPNGEPPIEVNTNNSRAPVEESLSSLPGELVVAAPGSPIAAVDAVGGGQTEREENSKNGGKGAGTDFAPDRSNKRVLRVDARESIFDTAPVTEEVDQAASRSAEDVRNLLQENAERIAKVQKDLATKGFSQASALAIESSSTAPGASAKLAALRTNLQKVLQSEEAELSAKFEASAGQSGVLLASKASGLEDPKRSAARKAANAARAEELASLRERAEKIKERLRRQQEARSLSAIATATESVQAKLSSLANREGSAGDDFVSPFEESLFLRVSERIKTYKENKTVGMNYLVD